jgi:PAS domain S-box-containing protein
VLPWLILGAGVVLATLAGALGVNAARRAKAQDELDRIFTLSTDVIAVADFDGNFTRLNPAAEQVLGYTKEELLELPYLDLVHPDDRERTAREAAAIGRGKTTQSFENRFVRKDGSHRVLEWTATPVVEDRLMYSMARDVTERRQAELERGRLAGEQAALRRVATLVARSVPAGEVFSAVAGEVERLLDAQATAIWRVEPDGTTVIVASTGTARDSLPVGSCVQLEPKLALAEVPGIRRTLAVPITVEGSLWGSIAAGTERDRLPSDAGRRVAEFTELAATAISNIQARSDLAASRARIGAAADEERRRVVRDLHDGAQQRMVHTIMVLRQAQQGLPPDQASASELVAEAIEQAELATDEIRELAAGLLPSVLRHGGLPAGLSALASRMSVAVELDVSVDRLPAAVEATAYFVVAEALTNVAKHARATRVAVTAHVEAGTLRIRVSDDGVGGARLDGSGLVGLADRLAVLDGQLRVGSAPEGGTLLAAEIPLPDGERAERPEQ